MIRQIARSDEMWHLQHGNKEKNSHIKCIIEISKLVFKAETCFFVGLRASSVRSNNLGRGEDECTDKPPERHHGDESGV